MGSFLQTSHPQCPLGAAVACHCCVAPEAHLKHVGGEEEAQASAGAGPLLTICPQCWFTLFLFNFAASFCFLLTESRPSGSCSGTVSLELEKQ